MRKPILDSTSICLALGAMLYMGLFFTGSAEGRGVSWKHLTSAKGDLPVPGESTQQTSAVVGDFDKDGVNDFVIGCRQVPPALIWFQHTKEGWNRMVIEKEFLTVEAGGAVHDIDGDGDLDIVFGGDWQSKQLWWWENPYPKFDPEVSWTRRIIKDGIATQHHDQVFGDFLNAGKAQLAFWNQQAKKIFLAEIPENPHQSDPWKLTEIFSGETEGKLPYAEGMSAFDIDKDGVTDLLAVNYWFKHLGGGKFKAVSLGTPGGLIFAGDLIEGRYPEIVISPGDASGSVKWYECQGNPTDSAAWTTHDLLGRELIHGHSLQLGDIDRDGHLDIFVAEMAKWGRQTEPDNPKAAAYILYGDGKGTFEKTEFVIGHGWHEARLADLDGDGDLDILNKPYTWETPRIDIWLNEGKDAQK